MRYHDLPAADNPVVNTTMLPDRYLITGQFETPEMFFEKLQAAFDAGIALAQFRAPWLEEQDYQCLARKASASSRISGARLLLKGDVRLLAEDWVDGLHLTRIQLHRLYENGWRYQGSKLLAASCHSAGELSRAAWTGCRFATLSPVRETTSHIGASPLGIERAARLTGTARLPVYWLGGMSEDDEYEAKAAGARGVAGISCYWR